MPRLVDWRRRPGMRPMNMDPNTHAFVLATALFTSIAFAIFATHVLVLVLSWILY